MKVHVMQNRELCPLLHDNRCGEISSKGSLCWSSVVNWTNTSFTTPEQDHQTTIAEYISIFHLVSDMSTYRGFNCLIVCFMKIHVIHNHELWPHLHEIGCVVPDTLVTESK